MGKGGNRREKKEWGYSKGGMSCHFGGVGSRGKIQIRVNRKN